MIRRVYTNGKELERLAPGSSRIMCFVGMCEMLHERLQERFVIPVMDAAGEKAGQSLVAFEAHTLRIPEAQLLRSQRLHTSSDRRHV